MNKIMVSLFFIFLFTNLVDLITAYFILPAEANPLFLITGNLLWLAFYKIAFVVVIGFLCIKNTYPSNFIYFMFILILVLGSLLVTIGIWSNVQGILNPKIVEQSAQLSSEIKTEAYVRFVSIIYILPMSLCLLSFKLYEWSLSSIILKRKKNG